MKENAKLRKMWGNFGKKGAGEISKKKVAARDSSHGRLVVY